jgi:hypothetical protein
MDNEKHNKKIEESELSDDQIALLNEMLSVEVNEYEDVVSRQNRFYKSNIDALQNTVTEFLDDFIIIGHTPDNRRIILRYAADPKSYDALRDLTREYLVRMMMGNLESEEQEGNTFS